MEKTPEALAKARDRYWTLATDRRNHATYEKIGAVAGGIVTGINLVVAYKANFIVGAAGMAVASRMTWNRLDAVVGYSTEAFSARMRAEACQNQLNMLPPTEDLG